MTGRDRTAEEDVGSGGRGMQAWNRFKRYQRRTQQGPTLHILEEAMDQLRSSTPRGGSGSGAAPVPAAPRHRGRSPEDVNLDTSRHSSLGGSSNHSQSSNEEKMPAKKTPAIRLQNGSRRWVSYFVLQEDKLRTTAIKRNVESTMLASLNASAFNGGGARAEVSRSAAVNATQEPSPYYLVEDYRVPPSEVPGISDFDVVGTTVKFPKGCKQLRVYAWLKGKDEWVLYRNKVYFKKRGIIQVVTAVDEQLDGYDPPDQGPPDRGGYTSNLHLPLFGDGSDHESVHSEEARPPRVRRDQGMAPSRSMGVLKPRGLDALSSSSGGEDEEEEEEELPWCLRELQLLDALVFTFGAGIWGAGRWYLVSRHLNNRSPAQCERMWALRHYRNDSSGSLTATSAAPIGDGGGPGAASAAGAGSPADDKGVSYRWGLPVAEHNDDLRSPASMAPSHADVVRALAAKRERAAMAAAMAATAATSDGPVSPGILDEGSVSSPAQSCAMGPGKSGGGGGGDGGVVTPSRVAGVVCPPFESTGGGGAGSSGRGPNGVRPWKKEEDYRLNALVAMFGRKWNTISDYMPGRAGMQCHKRFLEQQPLSLDDLDDLLPVSPVVSSEEQQRSMVEAREVTDAGAGLVKSGSLLSQQLMQYQQQLQGQGRQRSRTPFGSVAGGPSPEQSPSPVPRQQIPDHFFGGPPGSMGRSSGDRWMSGRGGGGAGCGQQGVLDEGGSDQGGAVGAGGSAWGGSNSTRALRRRGSSGSSEFYFVDTQQSGGTSGSYTQPPPSLSLAAVAPAYAALEHGNFARGGAAAPGGASTPRASRRESGHHYALPPRSPTCRTPPLPNHRTLSGSSSGMGGLGSGGGDPPRSPRSLRSPKSSHSPRRSMGQHQPPLVVPRVPTGENCKGGGSAAGGGAGVSSSPGLGSRDQQKKHRRRSSWRWTRTLGVPPLPPG